MSVDVLRAALRHLCDHRNPGGFVPGLPELRYGGTTPVGDRYRVDFSLRGWDLDVEVYVSALRLGLVRGEMDLVALLRDLLLELEGKAWAALDQATAP